MKRPTSLWPLSERQMKNAITAVTTGTGGRKITFGQENQRCAMSGSASGVHMLTAATAMRTPTSAIRAWRRAVNWISPSVLSTSHPAPSRAYPNTSAKPVSNENGVKQSKVLPTK